MDYEPQARQPATKRGMQFDNYLYTKAIKGYCCEPLKDPVNLYIPEALLQNWKQDQEVLSIQKA